jgi:hypothetical protein
MDLRVCIPIGVMNGYNVQTKPGRHSLSENPPALPALRTRDAS